MKKFKFTINGNSYDAEILKIEDNTAVVEVNGTSYNVEIDRKVKASKTPKLVRSQKQIPDTKENKVTESVEQVGESKIKSPLPGVILNIFVRTGDVIKKGDKLITLEAMKMENNVDATRDGKITKIHFQKGDTVLEGDILIEIGE